MVKISVDEFVRKYNMRAMDYDSAYGVQCVDLFNFYNKEVVGAPWIGTPITGGARDLFEHSSPARNENYKPLLTGVELQTGDVLVYGPPHGRAVIQGKQIFYGHVNIYIGKGRVFEQNGKNGPAASIVPLFKNGMIGVLRPFRFLSESSPPAVPPQPSSKNKHIIKKGDTYWGLEERYKLSHGTLQKLNPKIDPRALPIGRELRIRPDDNAKPSTGATYYSIRSGDTFWALETAWRLPHGRLQSLNPNVNPRALRIGQRIRRS